MTWWFVLLAGLLTAFSAVAAPTPAGTIISNQAQAVIDGQEVVPSNRVDTVVLEVCRAQFSPPGTAAEPGQDAAIVPPSTAYLPYVLSNQGNVTATFELGHEFAAVGSWLPDALNFYSDPNANGLVDANEPMITEARLAPGTYLRLIMAVAPPAGAAGELVVGPTADCGGLVSNEAFAGIEARPAQASALRLQQSVNDEGTLPDGTRRYALTTTLANYGGGDATGAWLEVDLQAALAAGLTLDTASLDADKGNLSAEVAGTWQPVPVAPGAVVTRLRLDLAGLAPDEAAAFGFTLVLNAPGEGVTVPLVASAGSGQDPAAVRSVSYIVLEAAYDHTLTRIGAESVRLIAGQPKCVPLVLDNTGTAADGYTFTTAVDPATTGVVFSLRTSSGLPLPAWLPVEASDAVELELCIVAEQARSAPFDITLQAHAEAGGVAKAATVSVAAVAVAEALVLSHDADPLGTVSAGSNLEYLLTIRNGHDFALTDVRIRNDLDGDLLFLGGTDDYTAGNHVARWQVGTLEPGETVTLRLAAQVDPTAADDTVVNNRFALTAGEIRDPVLSSSIVHTVWSSSLLLETSVAPDQGVTYGDALTYTLKVTNSSTAMLTLTLEERMAAGVAFLDSDTPAETGQASAGPSAAGAGGGVLTDSSSLTAKFVQIGSQLSWSGLKLAAGETIAVRYRARILPEAPKALENSTVARGDSVNGASVASAVATTSVQISAGVFERDRGVLLGRVFLDRDGAPGFNAGVDEPLAGVRLILGGGLQTLSDPAGLYAFRGVEVGVTSLLVDPSSLPFELRLEPNSLAPYRYAVAVHGLSVQDIEALAPQGRAAAEVGLELTIGPLTIRREIETGENGDRVNFTLESSEVLHDLVITDIYADGQTWSHTFESFDGSAELSFEPGGEAADAFGNVRWRYP